MLLLKNIFRCLGICIFCLPSKEEGGENGRGCGSRGGGAATNNIFAILILSTSDYSFAVCHRVTREQNKTPAWHRLGRERQAKPSLQKEKNDEKDLIIPHCCGWHIPVKVIKSYKLLELAVYHSRKCPCASPSSLAGGSRALGMEPGTGCSSWHAPRVSPRCPTLCSGDAQGMNCPEPKYCCY